MNAQSLPPRNFSNDTSGAPADFEADDGAASTGETDAPYQALLASIDEGFCVCEMIVDEAGQPVDYRFLDVNRVFSAMTGIEPDAIGRTARELVPGLEDVWVETYARVGLGGESLRFENGSEAMGRWFDVYAAPFGAPGQGRFSLIFKDITDNKRSEQALRESETRSRLAVEAAQLGTWRYEPATDLVHLDERMCRIWGQPPDAPTLPLSGVVERIHPDDQEQVVQAVGGALDPASTGHYAIEYRVIAPDGTESWVAANGQAQFSSEEGNRRPVSFIGTALDISARKRAEAALRESEGRFRHLAEALPEVVYTSNGTGRVDYLNSRWHAYTGQPRDLDPVEAAAEAMHPDDLPRMASLWSVALQGGAPLEAELRLRRHDGAYRWFITRVVPVRDAEGRTIRWFGTSTDIHAHKALEAELESRVAARTAELGRANQALEARNRELQDFAYVASHDLQEPLRKIRTFADLLSADYGPSLDGDGRHYVNRMRDAAARMSNLISDLLAFSRVSTRGHAFVPVDFNRIIEAVLTDLEVPLLETGARLERGNLPVVEADPTQMRQLMQNLIGNALKYRRAGETPLIRIEGQIGESAMARITVADNGIGFDQKYAERIFIPFQRLHGRGQYEGTGIGLAICRKIVERHGGTITAASAEGEGATFVVTLPVLQPDPEAAP